MNYLRTTLLLAALTALFMGIGYLFGGASGALLALLLAAGLNFLAYWNADNLVLTMHGAQEVDARTAPDLYELVRGLAQVIPNETAERVPASAHLFIVNPLSGAPMDNFFSTHPVVENRIAALRELAGQVRTSGYAR